MTTALPSGSSSTSTRPSVPPPSTRTGSPNVAPPSAENATETRPSSRAAVNHATATRSPIDASAGPLTGHPFDRPSVRMHRPSRLPTAVHEPGDADVADLDVRSVPVRDDSAPARAGCGRRTAVAHARIDEHVRSRSPRRAARLSNGASSRRRRRRGHGWLAPFGTSAGAAAVWRPSSQTMPTAPSGASKNERNPCSVSDASRWGVMGGDQVLPWSSDSLTRIP